MNKLMTKITTKMGKVGLILKKYEPEILVVTGAIGAVGSTVLACRATLKVSEVLDEHKDTINTIHDAASNEELKEENSNKNAVVASTQRDYIAGETSKTLTKNYLLPEVVVKAHEEGLIHFHDMDYFVQHIINCNVFNLDDMLQNGTVINKTLIEKPHTITTACNIATQIIALVASGQYGGQTISLTHLAPFVDESRKRIREELQDEIGDSVSKERFEEIVEKRVKREIERGVQILQYQINTLNTSNG